MDTHKHGKGQLQICLCLQGYLKGELQAKHKSESPYLFIYSYRHWNEHFITLEG